MPTYKILVTFPIPFDSQVQNADCLVSCPLIVPKFEYFLKDLQVAVSFGFGTNFIVSCGSFFHILFSQF
jgi:hypothetical protein